MTNALGTGSENISYNAPKDEARLLGREAHRLGSSRSELIRKALEFFFEFNNPDAAQRLREIRDSYRGAALLFLLLGSVACGGDITARPVRVTRGGSISTRKFEEA